MPNPQNPFVFNELYFANSTPPNVYKESTTYFIRLMNSTSMVVIGVLLSILLFFLICKKSPEHLRAYSKMLLLGTIVDTYILLQSFLLQIVSFV